MLPSQATVESLENAAHMAEVQGRSLWADARTRFFRNRAATFGLILLILIGLFALFGQFIAQHERDFIDFTLIGSNASKGVPSIETGHYFGTDASGRDLFARAGAADPQP